MRTGPALPEHWGIQKGPKPQQRAKDEESHKHVLSTASSTRSRLAAPIDNCRAKCLPCATRLKLPAGAFSKKKCPNEKSMHSYNLLGRERKEIEADLRPPLSHKDEQSILKNVIRAEC